MRLLLVEDSEKLSDLLVTGLSKEGFGVDAVSTIADSMTALSVATFAAVILDLGLPDGDGLAVVDFIRNRGLRTPVLALTARASVRERVAGLQRGADDYLVKPFAFDELVARIRALLRRPETFLGETLTLGRVSLDVGARQLEVNSQRCPIAPREATILEVLLRRQGRVVPKKVLEDQLYGVSEDGSANAVEVGIYRLRKQLTQAKADVAIHTIRGVGYLIKDASA